MGTSAGKEVTITANDGFQLAATLIEPTDSNGRVVLINSAMGVKRRYYAKYAAFLAEKGFSVLTYDYRGIGDSRPESLRGFPARLWEWGERDQGAAIAYLRKAYPAQKLLVVGHSIGGQIVGMTAENVHIKGVLGVAAQNGYWMRWPGLHKSWISLLWFVVVPLTTRVFGYFPGSLLRMGEDSPAGVAQEWAKSGRSPGYLLDTFGGTAHDHYAGLAAPMRSYSIEDDLYAPRKTVEALLDFYPNAQREHQHLRPADIGAQKIGHFGFFREAFRDSLWQESADWLETV